MCLHLFLQPSLFLYEVSASDIKNTPYTSVHCEKLASVITCNYSKTIGLLEKSRSHLDSKNFSDSHLNLILQ
jgi:hypothetical protein